MNQQRHAAPRQLKRTLSFRGGEDVTEALHSELERAMLQVRAVEAPKAAAAAVTDSGSKPMTPCRFTLVKPSAQPHSQDNGAEGQEDCYRPLTSLHTARGPWVLGDEVCHTTFSLYPLLEQLTEKSRRALLESVIDPYPTGNLEKAGKVNWHQDCAPLVALRTESDGNCLTHAAAVGSWGIHDRKLLLRNAVRSFLLDATSGEDEVANSGKKVVRLIRKAWEEELGKHGVVLEKEALDFEWAELARQAENTTLVDGLTVQGAKPKHKGGCFAYMEACHIYILAHVLRRPLILFATDWVDHTGRQLASADEIAGVYLPLELPRTLCSRTPLLLAYDGFHFSPLVPVDPSRLSRVPLAKSRDKKDQLLALPFFPASERNERLRVAVIKHYLNTETLEDGVLAVHLDDSTAVAMVRAPSPFSASSFPASGLLALLISNVVEDEEKRQYGVLHRSSLFRSASVNATIPTMRQAVYSSESSPSCPASTSLSRSTSRSSSSKQQQRLPKSSSCSALGNRAGTSKSSSMGTRGALKAQARQQGDKDLALALHLYLNEEMAEEPKPRAETPVSAPPALATATVSEQEAVPAVASRMRSVRWLS